MEVTYLIDDDFDKIVRRMFEQLFGNTTGARMPTNSQMRFNMPTGVSIKENVMASPRVERIDLEDRQLLIIDNIPDDSFPTAKVLGRELHLKLLENMNETILELPFAVDVDESSILHQNGIVEITLVKAVSDETSSDTNERILRIETRE